MSIAQKRKRTAILFTDDYCTCRRHDCAYKAKNPPLTCDYILITGHPRGCKVEECDKYKPGKMYRRYTSKIIIIPRSKNK